MRVLAVAQAHERGRGRRDRAGRAGGVHLFEAGADGGVVIRGGAKDFPGQPPLGFEREFAAAGAQFLEDGGVVVGRSDDGDVLVVLGRGADHGGTADVDVLDQFLEVGVGLRRNLFEAVQVDHHHVDGDDAVCPMAPCARGWTRMASIPPAILGGWS